MAIGHGDGNSAAEPAEAVEQAFMVEDSSPIDPPWVEAGYEEEQPRRRELGWMLPTLALLVVLGWTAFFGWVHRNTLLAGASPAQWSQWIIDWSVPVLLVIALWLLAMRNSRREAARFAVAAQSLSDESQRLEQRLSTVNRELSLARDFIAAQSRDLESLGRIAAERLSQNADRLQGLIRDNGEQVEQIGRVSTAALGNIDRLRDDLPVISNSARDVTSQIGQAGEVARQQLDEMIGGFNRLNEFGDASGRQVVVLRGKVEQAIAAFEGQAEKLEEVLGHRFNALTERSAAFRAELDGREVEAFAAMRRRADALGQEVAGSAEEIARLEREALAALSGRMGQVNDQAVQMSARLREGEIEAGERWSVAIASLEERMLEAVRRITEVDSHAMDNARTRLEALRDEAVRVDNTIAERMAAFDQHRALRDNQATEREAAALAELEQRLAAFDDDRASREAQAADRAATALASLEQRLAAFDGDRQMRAAQVAEREALALADLDQRLTAFDTQVSERQQDQLAHASGMAERSEALAARLSELSAQMDELVRQGHETQSGLAEAAAGFSERLNDSRAMLAESGKMVIGLTDDSVRLLELIRSSSEHTSGDLPQAIGKAEARLASFESQARAISGLIGDAGERGAMLAAHVAAARGDGLAAHDELAALEGRIRQVATQSEALAAQARDELGQAIGTLEEAARQALGNLQESQAEAIREIADRIGADSSAAIADALREHATTAIAELEEAAVQAGETGRATAQHLRNQLSRVNELAGNLEQRVAHARQRAEEQVDSDFTRRMALITESLNSNAIDISKAFANEVTDTAWTSYLRGDRGIFTRRAVRLLDNQEARGVAEIYQNDSDFRETVNRYIHDFEAMLRSVLSTRDGHALAVTLLSSDMGKLYVALAQAIERLR
jgi:hypothetical protein